MFLDNKDSNAITIKCRCLKTDKIRTDLSNDSTVQIL